MENKTLNSVTQYLFFMLENEKYAIKADGVQEIVDCINFTKVPKANKAIRGITNIRGDLIPIIDLKTRFSLGRTEITKRTSFIILNIFNNRNLENMPVAIIVNLVNEVDDISRRDILVTPEFGTRIEKRYIENILRYQDEYIIVLDIPSVLNIPELSKVE